ncbi:MAG: hypothetical protein DMD77_18970 [Candidatus Rokuibacteriota bacterium]|nr:MAG: hypothetical protein DMD77_18970 [Candidatus Rokubacteria bacterium]
MCCPRACPSSRARSRPSERWTGSSILAGLTPSFPDVLSALTTAPARRLTAEAGAGRVAVGSPADLVALERDPATDIRALADVRYTIRRGRIIYERAR